MTGEADNDNQDPAAGIFYILKESLFVIISAFLGGVVGASISSIPDEINLILNIIGLVVLLLIVIAADYYIDW
jgi:uncharacterized membrane-anchored protein